MSAGRRIQAGDASDQWRDSETLRQFATLSDISQGGVAIQLRCGGIFSDDIYNFWATLYFILNYDTGDSRYISRC